MLIFCCVGTKKKRKKKRNKTGGGLSGGCFHAPGTRIMSTDSTVSSYEQALEWLFAKPTRSEVLCANEEDNKLRFVIRKQFFRNVLHELCPHLTKVAHFIHVAGTNGKVKNKKKKKERERLFNLQYTHLSPKLFLFRLHSAHSALHKHMCHNHHTKAAILFIDKHCCMHV